MPAALVGYAVVLAIAFVKSTVVTWSNRRPRFVASVIIVVATVVAVVAAAPAAGAVVLARAACIVILSCDGLIAIRIRLQGSLVTTAA